ncbi:HAD family hydrolase [Catenuloplanes indicus]|uniref:Hydrolase of the HAD superfamily n=1 Tax=Catenuloplanes indicus TaxID=137267 RepID=A0AAE3VW18_9ACTN|nr:HAD family hydrolase [Catenuloplanes indicus]MDQ0364045.1 putative hydrolase of the HAD superfamily [Catenuloplanes indicus]
MALPAVNNAVEAVLLDLDGTLLDHEGAARTALREAIGQWLPRLSAVERIHAVTVWQQLEATHMQAYLDGTLSFPEQRRARLRGLLAAFDPSGDTLPDARADHLFAIYLRRYEASWSAYEDVHPALGMLRRLGLDVAILSNGDRRQQESKVAALGVAPLPQLFTPSEVCAAKPAPESFLRACTAMRWNPARVLYVGDNLHTDAVAATHAGLTGCWLDRHHSDAPALPPGVIRVSSLTALPITPHRGG